MFELRSFRLSGLKIKWKLQELFTIVVLLIKGQFIATNNNNNNYYYYF